MGIGCQRNWHLAATNHLSGRGFVQPLSFAAGRCAGRGCALIRQLDNLVERNLFGQTVAPILTTITLCLCAVCSTWVVSETSVASGSSVSMTSPPSSSSRRRAATTSCCAKTQHRTASESRLNSSPVYGTIGHCAVCLPTS